MYSNKNLIEILNIEGNEVAVSRQGINNCMVNLTQMAKPYGKRPIDWLKSKEGKEYIAIAEYMNSEVRNSHITFQPKDSKVRNSHFGSSAIITRQGGAPGETGTWCTDFHVALRFAQWLDPAFAWRLDDAIIKFLTGRNVGTLVNTNRLLPRDRKSIDPSFWTELRKYVLPKDIRNVAARMNVTLRHAQKVLAGTVTSYPVMEQFVTIGTSNRAKGIMRPESGNYEQLAFQFVEPNEKED